MEKRKFIFWRIQQATPFAQSRQGLAALGARPVAFGAAASAHSLTRAHGAAECFPYQKGFSSSRCDENGNGEKAMRSVMGMGSLGWAIYEKISIVMDAWGAGSWIWDHALHLVA